AGGPPQTIAMSKVLPFLHFPLSRPALPSQPIKRFSWCLHPPLSRPHYQPPAPSTSRLCPNSCLPSQLWLFRGLNPRFRTHLRLGNLLAPATMAIAGTLPSATNSSISTRLLSLQISAAFIRTSPTT